MNKHVKALLHLLIFFAGIPVLPAQSVAALQKQAEKKAAQGEMAESAALLERAGRIDQNNPVLLFQAAERYYQVRDYLRSTDCYKACKGDDRFPLAPLRYARGLKQQGRYDEALSAFQQAGESYRGDQKALVYAVIDNEKKGCVLAQQFAEHPLDSSMTNQVNWLGNPLNSPENEFAPLPFSDTLLYFSKTSDRQAILVRSSRPDSSWKKPVEAFGLPTAAANGFICGSFSTDGSRFYFSRAEAAPQTKLGGSIQPLPATLYALRRDESGHWSDPEPLRPYINLEGSANNWPYSCHIGDEEWLFFASDRAGGYGGMDLYYCKRPLAGNDLDFSFPINLGNVVNTGADETTPYYDAFAKVLWFSSMGHPSLGGFDVFSTAGAAAQWSRPENAGTPVNSPADDYFFVQKRDGSGAFLSSNRSNGRALERGMDDDLFEVFFPKQ